MAAQKGFTLIELLIVILIVGILAAVATPLYLGYVKDAKTAEAKAVAGALWSAVQGTAIANCGNATDVKTAFPKAGLTIAGQTTPARWTASTSATLTVSCADGAYTTTGPVFEIQGTASDVDFIRVQLAYEQAKNPPSRLKCSTDGGKNYSDC
jgi:prepilin-type N-terminal cleavage/methylation domain-containing protein